ncbi:ammonia channel protein, partial [Acinetobacter ursingii]
LTGVFAQKTLSGVEAHVGVQALGAIVTFLSSALISFIILFILDKMIGLRVNEEQEQLGLDLAQQGEHIP